MTRPLFLLLVPLLAFSQTLGVRSMRIYSSESDGLYNANAEESSAFRMGEMRGRSTSATTPLSSNLSAFRFSVNAIASGIPTTCTWNVACTNKLTGRDTIAAGDYNTIGEVSGSPSDLSCLPDNAQRLTVFNNRLFSTCKVRLVTIGGGTAPAVEFYIEAAAQ